MASGDSVLDQSRDLDGREWHRLNALYAVPEWVKAASAEDLCGVGLASRHYADPAGLLYPTHTKAATFASLLFFAEKRAHYPAGKAALVHDRLVRAAQFHGIGPAAAAVEKRAAELAADGDARLPDDAFAYVGPAEGGGKERRLRLANALEVKAAAEWLFRHRDRVTFPERRKIASRVLEKAAKFGASVGDLDEFLEKSAGLGGCSCADAVAAVRQRATLARRGRPAEAAELDKLAGILERDPANTRQVATLHKVAETLDAADRMLGVEYGGTVRRPEDILFNVTRKSASAVAATRVPSATGSVYDPSDLGRIRVKHVREHLGDDVAEAVTRDGLTVDPAKVAAWLPTATRPDALAFDRLTRAAGVAPRDKEAGVRSGLTAADLAAFAAQHRPAAS